MYDKLVIRKPRTNEYDYDIGISEIYNNGGFPLSYIPIAERI